MNLSKIHIFADFSSEIHRKPAKNDENCVKIGKCVLRHSEITHLRVVYRKSTQEKKEREFEKKNTFKRFLVFFRGKKEKYWKISRSNKKYKKKPIFPLNST